MSDFGDFEDDDAFDIEPADPEQVARKLHQLRRDNGLELGAFDDLTPAERALLVVIVAGLLLWLRRQGAE